MSHLLDETRRQLAILDLTPGVSWQQLKDRYRFLAKVWHPDRFGSDQRARSRAEKQFQKVNAAHQWLLQHQTLVESLADNSQTEGSDPAAGERQSGADTQEPSQQREGQRVRPRRARKSKKRVDESAVEKFLWGVVATFTLIAFTVFVASGSLSSLLNQLSAESSPGEFTPASDSSSSTGPNAADGVSESYALKYVTASRLYVRSEPSRDAPVISVLERGSRVRVESDTGAWLPLVRDDGERVGWLHGDYLRDTGSRSASSSTAADGRDPREAVDMARNFTATARAHQAMGGPSAEASTETFPPAVEGESTGELELIRGVWKPKVADPAARRQEVDRSSETGSDLERWTGVVDGTVPADLPRVTIRLNENIEVGQLVGGAVYWRQAGSCTYALESLQREGSWVRTSQTAESPECPPHGEIWFMVGESDMTAIWRRLDGSRWFTSRLKLD